MTKSYTLFPMKLCLWLEARSLIDMPSALVAGTPSFNPGKRDNDL